MSSYLAPGVELPTADGMLAGDFRRRQARPQALSDDLALLVQRPHPAPIAAGDDLNAWVTCAPMTYLMSGLSIGYDRRRKLVHDQLPSQHNLMPQCAAAESLTLSRTKFHDLIKLGPPAPAEVRAPHPVTQSQSRRPIGRGTRFRPCARHPTVTPVASTQSWCRCRAGSIGLLLGFRLGGRRQKF